MGSRIGRSAVCQAVIGVAFLVLTSGCANQRCHLTKSTELLRPCMQSLVLRPKYSEAVVDQLTVSRIQDFEARFLEVSNLCVQVIGQEGCATPETGYYYLDTEVTKFKRGSPMGRLLMTPVICFGLWGSYVYVDYDVVDPVSGEILAEGNVRKANQWGGTVGQSITAETQFKECPREILYELHTYIQDKIKEAGLEAAEDVVEMIADPDERMVDESERGTEERTSDEDEGRPAKDEANSDEKEPILTG